MRKERPLHLIIMYSVVAIAYLQLLTAPVHAVQDEPVEPVVPVVLSASDEEMIPASDPVAEVTAAVYQGEASATSGSTVALLLKPILEGNTPFDAQFCGAQMLSPEWAMTAIHCLANEQGEQFDPDEICIGGGSTHLDAMSRDDGTIVCGPEITEIPFSADLERGVALLHLPEPIQQEKYAHLPVFADAPEEGDTVFIRGWGDTEDGYPHELRQTALTVVDSASCVNEDIHGITPDNVIVANDTAPADPNNPRTTGAGDSGGSFIKIPRPGQELVLGPLSFGVEEPTGPQCNGAINMQHALGTIGRTLGEHKDGVYVPAEIAVSYAPTALISGSDYQLPQNILSLIPKAWSISQRAQNIEEQQDDGSWRVTNKLTMDVFTNGSVTLHAEQEINTTLRIRLAAASRDGETEEFFDLVLKPLEHALYLPIIQQ